MEFNGGKSWNKKISIFPKYEDLWWKGSMAFLFWKGEFHNGNYDIHLSGSWDEGSNIFGNRFSCGQK